MKFAVRTLPLIALVAVACKKEVPPPVYEAVVIGKRDIIVTAQAAGAINPDTIVEVKSKASGEILELKAETGQLVQRGQVLAQIDTRVPKNRLAQAEGQLEVAEARLRNAEAQLKRSKELFGAKVITEQELETTTLDVANAKAAVTSTRIDVENAKIALDDAVVRAPITGTIIAKNVERGAVISSPTSDVGGGTALLKMADLSLVQVKTFVDETDIGKLRPGLEANVTVDAYPNRPFRGEVLKIEPQADTIQNVTMFPVLVRIDNKDGLLKPGMTADVKISVGERNGVVAVPNSALRTERDVASAGGVLGIAENDLKTMLEAAKAAAAPPAGTPSPDGGQALQGAGDQGKAPAAGGQQGGARQGGNGGGQQGGGQMGGNRQGGNGGGQMGGGRRGQGGGGTNGMAGGRYIVFVQRAGKPTPVYVQTGLTDLDYSEVRSGLVEGDSVLLLPSASLIQGQQNLQQRMNRMGGGLPGQTTQQQGGKAPATGGGAPAGGGARPGGR